MLPAALTAMTVGTVATAAYATAGRAQGNATAERSGDGPFSLRFKASGGPTKAKGTFAYREPTGYTVEGK